MTGTNARKNGPAIHGDGNPPSQRLEVALPLCTFQGLAGGGLAGGGWAHDISWALWTNC